jgi:thiol-disulfide isomerase/thioredoxin
VNNQLLTDVVVDEWVQGGEITVGDFNDSVVLIEVFQVNCPGCFIYSLPKAIQLHEQYHDKGLVVIGLATAFEDYDKNTLENLKKLVTTGEVIGETHKALNQYELLADGKVEWRLPFAVGMDRVVPDNEPVTEERVLSYIHKILPEFDALPEEQKQAVITQVRRYMEQKTMTAETFERFSLQGTPSSILFDRKGQLRDVSFGQVEHKQSLIEQCL